MKIEKLLPTRIRRDGGTQPRASLDRDTITEYADAMRREVKLPILTVFFDGEAYWLADGFHRLAAHLQAHGDTEPIGCDVRQGTQRDAILHSVGVNDTHGLRRTNEDKRRAVLRLLEDEEWRGEGIRWIARQAKVSEGLAHKMYHDYLSVHHEQIEEPVERTVTRNGTTYTMNTDKIGSTQKQPSLTSEQFRILCEAISAWSFYIADKHPPIQYADGSEERVFYAFFKRWCISAVAKVVYKGQFQAQSNMLVLEGGQDAGKSSFVYWLGSPLSDFFIESAISPDNKDHLRYLCIKWIWEVAELGNTTRKADREALKAFVTQVDVTFRLPYGRHPLRKPAMASFIGTINNEIGFLSDPTGNRRFWVCGLKRMLWGYSNAIDVNQIWAQAYALFKQNETWHLTPEEREMRDAIHDAYTLERPYESWLHKYFDVDEKQANWFLSSVDIVEELVRRGVNDNRTAMQMQLAMTLRSLNLEKIRRGNVRGYQGIRVKIGPGGLPVP